ncbi:hypothetical protein C8Q79DRAFT_1016927 [Trametes meyenii]|nr:hypothetical protein C8Q79DRAFT_1016927 [Trametes meyenii]
MSVISHIPVIIEFFGILPDADYMRVERCREFQQYHQILSVAIQGVVAALMILRTYALYGRDRRILILLLAIIGAGGVVSLWVIVTGRNTHRPGTTHPEEIARIGCELALSQQEGYDLAIAWSSILVFDATVFILTLLQALKIGKAWRGGYLHVMLRDGTVYFGVLSVCYLSNILAYAPVHKGVSTSITNVLSTTLVTRLMLNIRDPDLHERPRRWGLDDTEV